MVRPGSRRTVLGGAWRRRLGALFVVAAIGLGLWAPAPAGAQGGDDDTPSDASAVVNPEGYGDNGIDVVEVEGLIDPTNASLMLDAIATAEERDHTLLIFQMSADGVLDVDPNGLIDAIRAAKVPVVVWVGPAGASVQGGAAAIARAAPVVSMASNATIGPVQPMRVDDLSVPPPRPLGPDAALAPIIDDRLDADEALEAGVADRIDPVLPLLITELDGEVVATADGPRLLTTAEVTGSKERAANQPVRFKKLSIANEFLHTLNTPWVAYFLFVAGALLMIFELYAASIGVAGMVGALCVVFACVGFSHLPVSWWALALVVIGLIGFTIDVQAGGIGFWTFAGAAALIVGSWKFYDGSASLGPSWLTMLIVIVGSITFMVGGMTAMIRSRFATPTLGREGLIGEMGDAEADVAPDGVVRVRDARWRARTNRATPIKAGDRVRVVGIEGVVLEVEPETGGARDYRERTPRD